MSIADEILRLRDAKAAIKSSLENKGAVIPDSDRLDQYYLYIDNMEVGGDPTDTSYYKLYLVKTKNGKDYTNLFNSATFTSLDLSDWDTSEVTDMQSMIYNCQNLTELNVSNFDTSNVTNMYAMFHSCYKLTSLDVSNFDTSNVTRMDYMFYQCTKLTELDLSNFNTSNVTNMNSMFSGCSSLTSLDLDNDRPIKIWRTSNVTRMDYMFYQCTKLTELDLSNWNTSNVTNMNSMFRGCESLTELDLSNWDTSNVTNMNYMFNSCKDLVDFKAPKNISASISFDLSNNLSHDSLMSIINNLATVTTTQTLTLGSTNLEKLTDEEISLITQKGWSVK